jgi:hypothetical protein
MPVIFFNFPTITISPKGFFYNLSLCFFIAGYNIPTISFALSL